jgi:hypothetical protein
MYLENFRRELIERKIRGYNFLFVWGLIGFILIYIFSDSFTAAITFAVYFWVFGIVDFFMYYFNIGSFIYAKMKEIDKPKGNFVSNFLIYTSIMISGLVGAFFGIMCTYYLMKKSLPVNDVVYGLIFGAGSAIGIVIAVILFYEIILKRL